MLQKCVSWVILCLHSEEEKLCLFNYICMPYIRLMASHDPYGLYTNSSYSSTSVKPTALIRVHAKHVVY